MDRKEFVKFWAKYVKEHDDKDWSKQQKVLIDSQIKTVKEFYDKNPELKKLYIEKLIKRKRS